MPAGWRGDAQARRGVALRVGVDQQHALADGGQGGAEVDGGGGLAHAALLVGDGQDAHGTGQTLRTRCSPSTCDQTAARIAAGSTAASTLNLQDLGASATSDYHTLALQEQSHWRRAFR